ncbi:MAG: hemin receptor, partial [Prevotella sp.]|nr:hemin receptor [Prevotella sp.]
FRDQTISSPGTAYATSTDYTNWKCTNRVTAGIGYSFDNFFMDLAYQYSQTNGDFYPFQNYPMNVASTSDSNYVSPSSVNFKRHQMLFTIGYKF